MFRRILRMLIPSTKPGSVILSPTSNSVLSVYKRLDFSFILSQSNLYRNEQGFIPKSALEKFGNEGRIYVFSINDFAAGYLLTTGGRRSPLVVRHNTIVRELWSHGYGKKIMQGLRNLASLYTPFDFMKVRTRSDLTHQIAINESLNPLAIEKSDKLGVRKFPVLAYHIPLLKNRAKNKV